MTKPQFEVRLLVKGREITKYEHINPSNESKGANWITDPDIYVEGREGSEFEIELINNSDELVLMIPSVDGLSVTDGKEASEDSQGYLVRPNSTVKVPGWTLDNDSVAKFIFAEKKKSYAAEHPDTPSETNVGVIGCLVFSRKKNEGEKINEMLERIKELEKQKPIVINPIYPWHPWDYYWHRPYYGPYYVGSSINTYVAETQTFPHGTNLCGGSVNTVYTLGQFSVDGSAGAGASSCNMVQCSNTMGGDLNINTANNVSINAGNINLDSYVSGNVEAPVEDFELGTGFGESMQFKTNTVTFEREALLETIVIYYDSRKNLEKKGIIVTKPKEEKKAPNPFPKMGCKPPKNWVEKA